MRLSPAGDKNNAAVAAAGPNSDGQETASAGGPAMSSFAAQLKAMAGGLTGTTAISGIAASPGLSNGAFAPAGTIASTPSSPAASSPAPQAPAPSSPISEPAGELTSDAGVASSAPIRGVHVQIAGGDDSRVDLRMMERAGSLSVSVRSSDGGVTRNLQDSLPELNSRLAEQHYQTEIWTPTGTFNSSASGNSDSGGNKNSGSFSNGNPNGNPSNNPNGNPGSPSGNSGQSQSGRQNKPPEWLPELASSGRESQIRRDYPWLQ
jgi:hypothetical protein